MDGEDVKRIIDDEALFHELDREITNRCAVSAPLIIISPPFWSTASLIARDYAILLRNLPLFSSFGAASPPTRCGGDWRPGHSRLL